MCNRITVNRVWLISASNSRLLVLALFFPLLLTLSSCSFFSKKVVFSGFSGYVLDQNTKQPIHGVVVFLNWQSEIVNFEIASGPPIYLDETVTDTNGYFSFPDSPPINVNMSTRVRSHAPIIGAVKEGYMFFVTSLSHKESGWLVSDKFSPRKREPIAVELQQASNMKSISNEGMTHSFLSQLELIFSPYDCVPGRLKATIGQLESILGKLNKDAVVASTLYGTVEMIINYSICLDESE